MTLIEVINPSEKTKKFVNEKFVGIELTEIVYVAQEFEDGVFKTTNVCFRVKNDDKTRGAPQELTHLTKFLEKVE